ncbi:MAG TPA: helix-turn-helix domain-containing protein [Chthonomonadaceae bacterium]|nr:helix-turn-helix domain-containing protein [Chthonomonadaceae bacterium]
MPKTNGITRREILTSIKHHGAMTAEELAQELGISQVAVRQHLSALEAEAVIAVSIERRGLGRPSHRYALTTHGDELFPRHYEALANSILNELGDWQGEEAVQQLFARQSERLRLALTPRLQGKSLAAKVNALANFQDESGFMSKVVQEDGATFRIVQYNCPFRAVAKNYPGACCAGKDALFRELLGDVEVEQEKNILAGDACCTFRISQTETK